MTKTKRSKEISSQIASFLSNGGKINKVDSGVRAKRTYNKRIKDLSEVAETVDMSALPTALKIRYGLK